MTNQEILKIAVAQSAVDLCAAPDDFEKSDNVIVTSYENDAARRYLRLPFSCQLVSYGNTRRRWKMHECFFHKQKYRMTRLMILYQ